MNRRFQLKGVVFDQDGLLIDSERIVKDSWDEVGKTLGYGALGEENIRHTLGLSVVRRKAYFLEKYGEDFPFDRFQAECRQVFARLAKEGIPGKKGLYELLQVLEERKIPMAVATSSSRSYTLENLRRLKIENYFQGILSGDMVQESKPDPEIYEKACALLQVEPKFCVALEDSPNGILAAHRAGMYTIMIPDLNRDSSAVDPILDEKMESLLEVAQWVKKMPESP